MNRRARVLQALRRHPKREPVGKPPPVDTLGEGLSGGRDLEPDLRRKMELAFGRSFSSVRVHAGPSGSELASRYGAAAVTVGDDIAFAAGRYAPGTPMGDALIAHELAHVAQRAGTDTLQPAPFQGGGAGAIGQFTSPEVEQDADRSALSAMESLYGAVSGDSRKLPRGAARPRRSLDAAVAPAICEKDSVPTPCAAPCTGSATCEIDSAVRPPAGRGALRLKVEGHTCIQAGYAELYRYEGDSPERCNFADALQPPLMVAPVALGCFTLQTPTTLTMVPGVGRFVLVRVVDATDESNTAVACATVTAN
jgi:hypothetical protein